MFGFGVAELMVVLAIVLFMFGWGRLLQLGNNFRRRVARQVGGLFGARSGILN